MITHNNVQQALPGLDSEQISQIHEQMENTASHTTATYLASTPSAPTYIREVQRQTRAMSLGREVAWAQLTEEVEARTPDWVHEFWKRQDLPPMIASIFQGEERWKAITSTWLDPADWTVEDWGEDPDYTEEVKARMIEWINKKTLPALHAHMFTQKLGSTWDLINIVEDSFSEPEMFQYQNANFPDLASLKNELMNRDWDQANPAIWSQEPSLLSWETFEQMLWAAAIQMRWEVQENPSCLMFPWATEILELKGPGPETFDELLAIIPTGLVLVD